jgi:hypothetical protein
VSVHIIQLESRWTGPYGEKKETEEKNHFNDLQVDGTIILKLIRERGCGMWTGLLWLTKGISMV